MQLFVAFPSFVDVRFYGPQQCPFPDQKPERLGCPPFHAKFPTPYDRRRVTCFDFFPNNTISVNSYRIGFRQRFVRLWGGKNTHIIFPDPTSCFFSFSSTNTRLLILRLGRRLLDSHNLVIEAFPSFFR